MTGVQTCALPICLSSTLNACMDAIEAKTDHPPQMSWSAMVDEELLGNDQGLPVPSTPPTRPTFPPHLGHEQIQALEAMDEDYADAPTRPVPASLCLPLFPRGSDAVPVEIAWTKVGNKSSQSKVTSYASTLKKGKGKSTPSKLS